MVRVSVSENESVVRVRMSEKGESKSMAWVRLECGVGEGKSVVWENVKVW